MADCLIDIQYMSMNKARIQIKKNLTFTKANIRTIHLARIIISRPDILESIIIPLNINPMFTPPSQEVVFSCSFQSELAPCSQEGYTYIDYLCRLTIL